MPDPSDFRSPSRTVLSAQQTDFTNNTNNNNNDFSFGGYETYDFSTTGTQPTQPTHTSPNATSLAHSERVVDHRFLIDGGFVPALIGKNGYFIQSLRHVCPEVNLRHTNNNFDRSISKVLTVRGTERDVVTVIERVIEK